MPPLFLLNVDFTDKIIGDPLFTLGQNKIVILTS